jgi:hypothetical protein
MVKSLTVTLTPAEVAELPALSVAIAASVCSPTEAVEAFQMMV